MFVVMILLLDNYDSFTYILNDYLLQCGLQTEVHRNDAIDCATIEARKYKGIVLSPGPNRPADSGILMQVVEQFHARLPLLGVCLGHQAIGEYFGASLVKATQPMHGKTSPIHYQPHPVFKQLSQPFTAMRYHSLVLKNVQAPLQIVAETASHEIMAIAHQHLPLFGVQFHPESVLTVEGLQLLRNWKSWCNL